VAKLVLFVNTLNQVTLFLTLESDSHTAENLADNQKVADEIGCRVLIIPYFENHSSTQIKREINENN